MNIRQQSGVDIMANLKDVKDEFPEILIGGSSKTNVESSTLSPALLKSVQLPSTSKDILSKVNQLPHQLKQ